MRDVLLAQNILNKETDIIAGYWAIGNEINLRPLLYKLDELGYTCVLPYAYAKGAPLEFREWKKHIEMAYDECQIIAPNDSMRVLVPNVVLMPMTSFDKTGMHRGYGINYYDPTVEELRAKYPNIKVIGVAYSSRETVKLPPYQGSQRVDYILTERSFYPVNK